MPKGKTARATVAGSPSRLSRMTLQDAQAAEEEGESASEQGSASATLNRADSVLVGLSDVVDGDHVKQKPELQLHLPSNAELSHGLSRTASTAAAAATVRSPRMMSQELREESVAKDESTESVVPPWRSNSAAAWVKQNSFRKSLSAKAFPDWDQQEEELQRKEQQAEPDQDEAASPHARARQSASGPGRAQPLGSLHIEVEEQPQQDGLQDWAESGLDDIAAAVAQYTRASPDDLLSTEGRQQVEEQNPEQLLQQRQRPQAASLQLAGFRSATQSPRVEAKRQYGTEQEQMEAELEAAMAADAEPVAERQHNSEQEQMEAGMEAVTAAEMSGPTYANAQEQMEAELEAAMTAEICAPKYANAQEQMEAELEAAMAADAAANVAQDERHARENDMEYPEQWQQKDKEIGAVMAAKTSSAAPDRIPLHYSEHEGRAGQTLSLPGDGDGLDLDADGIINAQYLQDKMQKVRITPCLWLLRHYLQAVKHN